MEFFYEMSTKVYFKRGCIASHSKEFSGFGEKAMIVTGKHSSKKNGSLQDVIDALNQQNISFLVFDQVEENPSLETINHAAVIGKQEKVDFCIGIGGGSPLDAAKAIAVFIANEQVNSSTIFSGEQYSHLPVIAVPTTSGTGSEVTPYSIVSVSKLQTKVNLGQRVFPVLSFLDPSYTDDLPKTITINTTIDAFTHLVEGFLNTNANEMSDVYAREGFRLMKECLFSLKEKTFSKQFRNQAMLASMYAGMEIAQTGTSLPHGMGYPLTYHHNLPHGIANGILMSAYLDTLYQYPKLQEMINLLGLESLAELKNLLGEILPKVENISKDKLENYASSFFSNKQKLKNHPQLISKEEILEIYTKSIL